MTNLNEAATVRARARAAAKAMRDLLAERVLPASIRRQVENLHAAMSKTWADLEDEASLDPEPHKAKEAALAGLVEAASTGVWLEAQIHRLFTEQADFMYGDGYLTRDERKALSGAIGAALDVFVSDILTNAPQLYERPRWQTPDETPEPIITEQESAPEPVKQAKPAKAKKVELQESVPLELSEFTPFAKDSD